MLITMPYLTIKHETRVPSRSFRGERNPVSLTKVEVVLRQIKCPEMCERALVRCQRPALPCTHLQTGSNTNRHHVVTSRNQDANNQVRAEQAGMVQPSPTVRSHQEPQPTDSCKGAVRSCKALRHCEELY